MADVREHKRFQADAWDFLTPWLEHLHERLMVHPDGYLQVRHPDSRRFRRNQNQETEVKRPERFDTSHWRTREAVELLVLVHAVNNQAQKPGELSPVKKWRNFLLPHTSDYEPSPEFLEAKQRILLMKDEGFKRHPRVPQFVEIPISLSLGASRDENRDFVAHMKELRDLIEEMKGRAAAATAAEVCVESVLDVLGTGIPVVAVVVNPYNRFRGNRNGVSRQALAKFLIGVLLDPSWKIHSIGTFDFIGEHDWHYQALYAALAAARTPVANLSTHGCFFRQDDQLQLLAKALFSPRSSNQAFYPPIHGLDILYEKADLETIVAAIKEKESGFMTEWQLREAQATNAAWLR
ncbi:hypothetical protein PHYSODRAFT_294776 [Phytophthora sojae]|uniref:Uncharacterized protein n=1 Tax=Phytophthora sojae (strain P6497) TaxID=1094619 RepID=G4YL21_PHYSP|nr:hypothetical protein PHYSODRAFT_294776 [Phytophthora sojae]EGZ29776.1 hypothetical protein PHYSODRAFT_294776 [Phytophthora sojae]|eukprot:XP_009517051.1 hypothetical protein PHYSODRAFT_294776 [Phytophthora sojae]